MESGKSGKSGKSGLDLVPGFGAVGEIYYISQSHNILVMSSNRENRENRDLATNFL